MKLNENWWSAVDWNDFNNEQRRKTVLWLEEHYGKDFAAEANFGNRFVKPPVRKGRLLSSLKDFSEDAIGFYPNGMLRKMVLILGCWNPARFLAPRIEAVPMREPYYVSISGKIYHSEKEAIESDKSFRRMFPELCKLIGEEEFARLKAKRQPDYEYKVVCVHGEQGGNAFYDSLEAAQTRARHLAQTYFRLATGGESMEKYHDFSGCDWMKQEVVEYPKSVHSERLAQEFNETSYFDRLRSPDQDDEFLKFAEEEL